MSEMPEPEEARYIYCVARCAAGGLLSELNVREELGSIGIEKSSVFTVTYQGLAAVVHACQPLAYDTRDQAVATDWIIEHSYVIDQAMKKFPAVLPFSFDVIMKGGDCAVRQWLERNREALSRNLEKVEGRAEYGIQIYYHNNQLAEGILARDPDLQILQSRIEKESRGKAYLLQKKLDQTLKGLASKKAAQIVGLSLDDIKSLSDDLLVDEKRRKPEEFKDHTLLASYTCLVQDDAAPALGKKLDEINCLEGFRVRFTGPWAPFSFVSRREDLS